MHQKFIIISTQVDTSFYVEIHMRENHKFFFFFFFNLLHRFVGTGLLEEPTHKICKQLLAVGYNLINTPTSMETPTSFFTSCGPFFIIFQTGSTCSSINTNIQTKRTVVLIFISITYHFLSIPYSNLFINLFT